MLKTISVLLLAALSLSPSVPAANIQSNFTYQSTVTSISGVPLSLRAELHYNNSVTNAPIAVVMHGYSTGGDFANVRANAMRLRDAGFFAISVALRGRESSQGTRDSGGVEVYDIYDAAEAAKVTFAPYLNPSNIHITGYSGGGANVMSALTKFPDYFRLGSSFFGMGDYGFHPVNGWYQFGAGASRTPQLDADIGNPNTGGPLVVDKYHARASNLASRNNPYSEIHLFVNHDEPICPAVNSISYRTNAVAAQSFPGEFTNIVLHLGTNGVYRDFNSNSVNEASELQYWVHGYPSADQQASGESWYLTRVKNGLVPQPQLNANDNLFVAGWVKTKPFDLWLGDGQNAAGSLTYSLSAVKKQFTLGILSSVKSVTGRLKVNTSDMAGKPVQVRINGVLTDSFTGGGIYTNSAMGDGQTIQLTVPVTISVDRSATNLVLNWPGGDLLEATTLTGPWTTNTTAISPHTIAPTNLQKFFRVKVL